MRHFSAFSRLSASVQVVPEHVAVEIKTPGLRQRQTRKLILNSDGGKSSEDKHPDGANGSSDGLAVYLISDPDTPTAGAALSVDVGSWDDGAMFPGMAHACEHFLFLGTQKFPDEDAYERYLRENGGMSNAYTASGAFFYCLLNLSYLSTRLGILAAEASLSDHAAWIRCHNIHSPPNYKSHMTPLFHTPKDHTLYYFTVSPSKLPGALDRFAQFFIDPLFRLDCVDRELNGTFF